MLSNISNTLNPANSAQITKDASIAQGGKSATVSDTESTPNGTNVQISAAAKQKAKADAEIERQSTTSPQELKAEAKKITCAHSRLDDRCCSSKGSSGST